MSETWHRVPGDFDCYEVSDLGRVRNARTGYVLRPGMRKAGYRSVTLFRDGQRWTVDVHRLVLLAFVGPPPSGHNVNHIDGSKENNTFANLEYVTFQQNSRHAVAAGLWTPAASRTAVGVGAGEAHPNAKLTDDAVRAIRKRLAAGEPAPRIAADYGVTKWSIYNLKRGRWSHI